MFDERPLNGQQSVSAGKEMRAHVERIWRKNPKHQAPDGIGNGVSCFFPGLSRSYPWVHGLPLFRLFLPLLSFSHSFLFYLLFPLLSLLFFAFSSLFSSFSSPFFILLFLFFLPFFPYIFLYFPLLFSFFLLFISLSSISFFFLLPFASFTTLFLPLLVPSLFFFLSLYLPLPFLSLLSFFASFSTLFFPPLFAAAALTNEGSLRSRQRAMLSSKRCKLTLGGAIW